MNNTEIWVRRSDGKRYEVREMGVTGRGLPADRPNLRRVRAHGRKEWLTWSVGRLLEICRPATGENE